MILSILAKFFFRGMVQYSNTSPTMTSVATKRWAASSASEGKKLSMSDAGWNLAGIGDLPSSRTRGNRVSLERPPTPDDIVVPATAAAASADAESTISSLTETVATPPFIKTQYRRVIVEVNPMRALVNRHLQSCPNCGSTLEVTFPTDGIASGTRIACTNEVGGCTYVAAAPPAQARVPMDMGRINASRNTDYALNICFVLSLIQSGDGGTEAARVLGLCGLPNATTMQSRTFGTIESTIYPVIESITENILFSNLKAEVALVFGDEVDNEGNKLYDLWLEKKLPRQQWPVICCGGDMGWSQKGSGRTFNSNSGHAMFIANLTRKPIAKYICCKSCKKCKTWYRHHAADEDVPEHECVSNFDGTSGSMEPEAMLQMYKALYDQYQTIVGTIVTDDDSSIKAKMKWSNADHMKNNNTTDVPKITNRAGNVVPRPDKGGIPGYMPEPGFLADPNHRRKTLANELYALEKLGKQPDKKNPNKKWNMTMTKMDVLRVSKNFAFMGKTLKNKTTDEDMLKSSKAVIEHHFDNHECCGEWCRRRSQTEDERKKHFYRCKEKDAALYEKLQQIIARFITIEALRELAHSLDTNANESFNQIISWMAPKNKVYSMSISLKIRVGMAIGINTLGLVGYYREVFDKLGMFMTSDVYHYLQVKDTNRHKRITKAKTPAAKRRRQRGKFEKLKKHTEEAKRARCRRDGSVYQSGIGMDGGYMEEDATATTAPRRTRGPRRCGLCRQVGHDRRHCTSSVMQPLTSVAEDTDQRADADEIDAYDSRPLVADSEEEGFFSADEFDGSDSSMFGLI